MGDKDKTVKSPFSKTSNINKKNHDIKHVSIHTISSNSQCIKIIEVIPVSQLNYIKAGINIEGYELILSFRRQMFINQKDFIKLPGSLVINFNHTSFRIFFTDDRITCFLCKAVGYTSMSCKKQTLSTSTSNTQILNNSLTTHNPTKSNEDPTTELLEDILLLELSLTNTTPPQNIMDWNVENQEIILSHPTENNKTT
jgi:hypothetical protein